MTGEVPCLDGLLTLLNDAPENLTTLEAEYRDWVQPVRDLSLALERSPTTEGPAGTGRLYWRGPGPFARSIEVRRKIWLVAPDRLKVQIMRNGRIVRLGVQDRNTWWRWDQRGGEATGDAGGTADGSTLPPLLDPPLLTPARVLGWLRLKDVGTGLCAGRPVVTACGRPRTRSPSALRGLRYELEFDREYGIMLRSALYDDRQCIRLTEASDVTYGGVINAGLFAWPPPGIPA